MGYPKLPGLTTDGRLYEDAVMGTVEALLPTGGYPTAHAPAMLELADGALLCCWFAGTYEGSADIRIICSRLEKDGGQWSEPTDISGDPEQVARLKKLDEMYEPAGFGLDEVGLVTMTPDLKDNDAYWTSGRFQNGTHSHDTIHIALGKNAKRAGVVHSNLHMDMDIRRPTVSVDGQVVIKDGVFVDDVWKEAAK